MKLKGKSNYFYKCQFSEDFGFISCQNAPISQRSMALLLLQKDLACWEKVQLTEAQSREIEAAIAEAQNQLDESLAFAIAKARQE